MKTETGVQLKSRKRWKTVLLNTCALGAVVYTGWFGYFYHAMCQPPEQFGRVMMHAGPVPFLLFPFETMWKHARAGSLRPGALAPDFTLPRLDGSGSVQLSSFRGQRPVVLVFGSYT